MYGPFLQRMNHFLCINAEHNTMNLFSKADYPDRPAGGPAMEDEYTQECWAQHHIAACKPP